MIRESLLAPFRARENKEVAALVLADKSLQKLLAAWPLASLTIDEPGALALAEGNWDALWACCEVDRARLETLTGMQGLQVQKTLERAIALRLIYPDGTIHALALMVLRKQIKNALAD